MTPFLSKLISYGAVLLACGLLGFAYYEIYTVPSGFPVGKTFTIDENESLLSISTRLENEHYIHSALLFRVWISTLGKDRHMQLGSYQFNFPFALSDVVRKFVTESPDKPLIQVTVPEGSTTHEVALLVKQVLPAFSTDIFEERVTENNAEGKLFPSTYFLLPSYTENDVIRLMTETFEEKYTSTFKWTVIPEPLSTREQVVSLAAIIEGEAKNQEDMHMIAGILLSRLKLHMPLQVDAAKGTYATKELPKVPIDNPGLVALSAVIHPIQSDFLYYLTDPNGVMHYAKTFAEHKANIKKYLR